MTFSFKITFKNLSYFPELPKVFLKQRKFSSIEDNPQREKKKNGLLKMKKKKIFQNLGLLKVI